jgi:phage tail-like protein
MDDIKVRFKLQGPNIKDDEVIVTSEGLRVGRSGDNDLPLDHGEISRYHMRIFLQEGGYWVEDQNSSNGVWLNDMRVRPKIPYQLKLGDAIRCGPFIFRFEELIQPAPAEAAAPLQVAQSEVPPSEVPDSAAPLDVVDDSNGFHPIIMPPAPPSSLVPIAEAHSNGFPEGIPRDRSNWLQYLPAIYGDDDFLGRYLLIFESIMSPIIWMIDSFDFYLSPEMAPAEWLQWIGSWFDIVLVPELPIERQRAIISQLGWLFLRRSTRLGLERMLELYFGVKPEIIEKEDCHFVVKLALSKSGTKLGREVADRLITSQKPAYASYSLEIT